MIGFINFIQLMIDNPRITITRWSAGKRAQVEEHSSKRSSDRKHHKPEQKKTRHLLPEVRSPTVKIETGRAPEPKDRMQKTNVMPDVPLANRRTTNKQKGKGKIELEPCRNTNNLNSISPQCTTLLNPIGQQHTISTAVPGQNNILLNTGLLKPDSNFICGIPLIIETLQQVPIVPQNSETKKSTEVTKKTSDDRQTQEIKYEPFQKWRKGTIIGSGSTSEVYKILDQNTGMIAAGKNIAMFANDDPQIKKSIKSELDILCRLEHPNIVKFYKYVEQPTQIWFFMEYLPETLEMIYQNYGAINPDTIKQYSRQLLFAVKYLHDNKIIHKDIKCSNILVSVEGTIKLSDFGSSKRLDQSMSGNFAMTFKGSVRWMAPQILTESRYGKKSDIWSVGCAVLEMASGKVPWADKDFENYMTAIYEIGNSDQIPQFPQGLPPSLEEFLKLCLTRDPQKRASIDQLLQSKFLNS